MKAVTNLYRDHYFAPVFKAAKLSGNPYPHQFRHTFAIKLLTSGTSVENVAALLGNTPRIVWKHYAACVKERQEALDHAVLKANGLQRLTPAKPQERKQKRGDLDRRATNPVQKSTSSEKYQ